MEKPNVVVVGGGTAGIAAAQALHEATNVTLVDSSPYMEIHWSGLRSMVEPETVQKLGSLVDYDSIPRIGKFVQGVVKAMTDEVVILESGKQLVFDYAVLCMGSSYSDETIVKKRVGSKAERMEQFTEMSEKIKSANSVVVVGGGVVGVEMAAEVRCAFPDVTVRLVTNGASLITDKPPALGAKCAAWLEKNNVELIYNNRVVPGEGDFVTLTNIDQNIEADVVLWCTNPKCNTSFVREAFPTAVNEKGQIKVNKYLLVEGKDNIFAAGDCNDVPETKLGYLALMQGSTVGKSIVSLNTNEKEKTKLHAWSPGGPMDVMFVTLGPKAAILGKGKRALTGWFPAKVKANGLLVWKTRKDFGIKSE